MHTIQTDYNGVTVTLTATDAQIPIANELIAKINTRDQTAYSWEDLNDEFRAKVKTLLARCSAQKQHFRPYCTVRDPWQQARLWRQSRPIQEIQRAIRKLEQEGAPWLAGVLQSVGPQNGRWTTNALPGQSWHNWGLAVDCFLLSPDGRAIWSSEHPGYALYAELAEGLGLTCGYMWKRKDSVHVQSTRETVKALYTWPDIDNTMKKLFMKG